VISGGVVVEIKKIEEEFYIVKNIDGSEMKIAKDYIAAKLDK
jgi:preprotein translocase subunit YajC